MPNAENAAGCACDPEDAALAEVRWLDAAERLRVTCALCGSTKPHSARRGAAPMTALLAVMIMVTVSFVAGRLFEAARRVDGDLELAAEVWDDCNREHGTEAPNPYRTEA